MVEREDLERRTVELLQQLIQFNTVNPPGNEEACQTHLAGTLEQAGFEVELLAAVPGRPNLVARMPAASDGPVLTLLGHVDTVLADSAEWKVSPWSGELRDGCVWGRGALDMKSQVAAEVAAACALAEAGWRPEAGELKIVLTADEETGAEHGARWLCEHHADKVRSDVVINEGAGMSFAFRGRRIYPVCVAEKGVFRFTITAHGRAGHASIPRIGDNALAKLAPVLDAMRSVTVQPERSPEPEALLSTLGVDTSDLGQALHDVEAVDPRVAVLVEPLLGVTMAPTMVSASEKINVIPSTAQLRVDCRVPPGQGEDYALARIRAVVGDEHEITFDETVVGNRSPIETPLMEAVHSFIQREDPGAVVTATALAGFSDSRWFRDAFPNAVVYGFFPQRSMDLFEGAPLVHGADERIPVDDLGFAARFFAETIETMLR